MLKLSNKALLAIGVVGVLSVGAYSSYYTVKTGEVGIVLTFGEAKEVTLPGLHFKTPFRDSIHVMDTRTLGASVSFDAATQDQQRIDVVIDIQWDVAQSGTEKDRKAEALGIFARYGSRDNFDTRILDTRAGAVTKAITGTYTLTDIITKRGDIQKEIETALRKELAQFPITIAGIQAKQLEPSTEYREAIERKQIAEVDADAAVEKAKGIETIARADMKAEKLRGEGAASKILQQKEAEAAGLELINTALLKGGPGLTEYVKWGQTWNGEWPTTVVMSDDQAVKFGIGTKIGQTVKVK